MPVFKIRPQGDPEAKPRILHRNLLQPIRQVDTSEVEDQKASPSQNQENLDDSDLKDIFQAGKWWEIRHKCTSRSCDQKYGSHAEWSYLVSVSR